VLALDIGGTRSMAAVVGSTGAHGTMERMATPTAVDAEGLFRAVAELADRAIRESKPSIHGIGVGCGGPMRGALVSPLHIPAWRDFPLRSRLEERFGLPCVVDNDAKAMALGEWWRGAGRSARAMLGIVVSTGVGGGVVIEGRLLDGASGNAGHIGHVLAFPEGPPCDCGATGCVEAVASGSAIARRYGGDMAADAIAERARSGQERAREMFADAGTALARGIAAAAALCDLDRVVLGGGVALGAWDLLRPSLAAELARVARLQFTRDLDVRLAELGERAGVVGAAALALLARR
jgi:glucokinase